MTSQEYREKAITGEATPGDLTRLVLDMDERLSKIEGDVRMTNKFMAKYSRRIRDMADYGDTDLRVRRDIENFDD